MKGADHFTSCEFIALLENNSYSYPPNKTAVVHLLWKKKVFKSELPFCLSALPPTNLCLLDLLIHTLQSSSVFKDTIPCRREHTQFLLKTPQDNKAC